MIEFGTARYDDESRVLYRDGDEIALPPRVLAVLEALLQRPGEIVPKEEILALAWSGAFVGEDSLTQAISQLRQALGDDPQRPLYIQTIPRRGYRLIIEVSRPLGLSPADPVGVPRPADAEGLLPVTRRSFRVGGMILLAAGAIGLIGLVLALSRGSAPPANRPVTRLSASLPRGFGLDSSPNCLPFAVAPDGSRIAYSAVDDQGNTRLYLRALDEFDAWPVGGAEGGYAPFFDPRGEWLGFVADHSLKKVSVAGGAVLTIAEDVVGEGFAGASWGTDGNIVFAPSKFGGLFQVPETGGVPTEVVVPDAASGELGFQGPKILPGERGLLVTTRTGTLLDTARVEVRSLDGRTRQVVAEGGSNAWYAATGHVVYGGGGALAGSLWAVPLDLPTLAVTGEPVRVLDDVRHAAGMAYFALADNGSLVYVPQGPTPVDELLWAGIGGDITAAARVPGNWMFPRLSPDGQRLAVTLVDTANVETSIWLLDIESHSQVLFANAGSDHLAVWTPDGTRIVFASNREGPTNLYWQRLEPGAAAERLTQSQQHQDPGSWSPDGRLLAFAEVSPVTGWDLWVLDVETRTTTPLLRTPAQERQPMISPDGRWLAYTSDETGRSEVYLRAFPGAGDRWLISAAGGNEPLWSRDGRQLFYRSDGYVFRVTVGSSGWPDTGGSTVVFDDIFEGRKGSGAPNYEIDESGDRFLVSKNPDAQPFTDAPFDVVLNWFEELLRLYRGS